jgi:uncharacterized protein (DUF983 family)
MHWIHCLSESESDACGLSMRDVDYCDDYYWFVLLLLITTIIVIIFLFVIVVIR